MVEYWRAMKYPLVIWFLWDTAFTVLAYFVPTFATVNPTADAGAGIIAQALPLGAMAGYKMIQLKGNLFNAMVVGIVTGLWCVFLSMTEVGLVLSPFGTYSLWDMYVTSFPLFTADMIGAIIGAGIALARRSS